MPPAPAAVRLLLLAVLCAASLRVVHLRAITPLLAAPPPPGMDRSLAMQVAGAIAGGDVTGGWAAPYDSSPGYSYALALLHRAGGRSWYVPVVVQLLLGASVPVLLHGGSRASVRARGRRGGGGAGGALPAGDLLRGAR